MNNLLDTTYSIIRESLSGDEMISKLNVPIHLELQCISVRDMASYTTDLHMVKIKYKTQRPISKCVN